MSPTRCVNIGMGRNDCYAPSLVCGNGHLAETIINPSTFDLHFLVYDRTSQRVTQENLVNNEGLFYLPLTQNQSLCTCGIGRKPGPILLPTEAAPYQSEQILLTEVRNFIHRYVELDEENEILASCYVLFTWLFDRFDEVSYLRFICPDFGSGKSRALETIGSICYRPMFVGGASTAAALRRMIDMWKGTLVSDEQDVSGDQDLTASYTKIMNQGFQRGRPLVVCTTGGEEPVPQMFSVFGPKILVTRQRFPDDALESRCLTIQMRQRTRSDVPVNLPRQQFDAEALSLRNRLLQFRFEKFHTTNLNPELIVADISDRLNQIGIPLLSTVQDPNNRDRIRSSLQHLQTELRGRWEGSNQQFIIETLQRHWSCPNNTVTVSALATMLNTHRSAELNTTSEFLRNPVTPHKMGRILREELGLQTERTARGYIVVRDMKRLTELIRRYCPPSTPPPESSQSSFGPENLT